MKTCLVVDDMKFDRIVLEKCASKLNFDVRSAASGEEALTLCRTALPDCMLIDWEMAGMKGVEVLQKLRMFEGGKRVCVIMCTSHDHANFIGQAHSNGANGFISKPITLAKLEQKLMVLNFQLPAPPDSSY